MDKITCKIDVKKIDKAHLYAGKKGTYLNVTLIPNKDGKSQYGDDYFIVQDVSKEARDAGEKGAILGNARIIERKQRDDAPPQATRQTNQDDEQMPF